METVTLSLEGLISCAQPPAKSCIACGFVLLWSCLCTHACSHILIEVTGDTIAFHYLLASLAPTGNCHTSAVALLGILRSVLDMIYGSLAYGHMQRLTCKYALTDSAASPR